MKERAAVIGAGIGGIVSALRLRHSGFEVEVFEAASLPGGKIAQIEKDGFRFDTGPSLFTLPSLVNELFELFGKIFSEYFSYRALPVITKYFYEDGTEINAYNDPGKFADEIERKANVKAGKVRKYLKDAETVYDLTANNFIFKAFELSTVFTKDFLRATLRINKLNTGKTMHQVNQSYFKDGRVIQLFDRYATYNGSDPYQTPGTLAVIPHLEHNIGAFFPEKGMYDIVRSLYRLAVDEGIRFRFSEKVSSVNLDSGVAKGVETQYGRYDYDLVVSDVDIFTFYDQLLPNHEIPQKQLSQERSSSALIFYWGVKGLNESLDVHNILFSQNYKREFEKIFSEKTLPEDPTVHIFISGKVVEGDAPDGHENWFVMINTPANDGQDWDSLVEKARENIIEKIHRMLDIDIRQQILFEERLDPRTIESKTGSWKGSLYGNSSNNKFAAFMRHKNKTSKIKNLYFAGGSVHPGGGIPLCLASAKIMASKVKADWK
ncbi:MAG: phytoene desaturase [Bacteroidales bacterium]|nr:phytoene desaturase [Bacteroidales bacterium]MCF8337491.1 phytoene desaturase [Bacteroidales bacterium]